MELKNRIFSALRYKHRYQSRNKEINRLLPETGRAPPVFDNNDGDTQENENAQVQRLDKIQGARVEAQLSKLVFGHVVGCPEQEMIAFPGEREAGYQQRYQHKSQGPRSVSKDSAKLENAQIPQNGNERLAQIGNLDPTIDPSAVRLAAST